MVTKKQFYLDNKRIQIHPNRQIGDGFLCGRRNLCFGLSDDVQTCSPPTRDKVVVTQHLLSDVDCRTIVELRISRVRRRALSMYRKNVVRRHDEPAAANEARYVGKNASGSVLRRQIRPDDGRKSRCIRRRQRQQPHVRPIDAAFLRRSTSCVFFSISFLRVRRGGGGSGGR